ncbi:hypothetical protein [Lacrimispora sp.]|jgi:hypothetical protein|uniref:hypothetical protein n=1 Tax=Lacrimispora sp. TaxID=2719234 RepID=UPI0028B06858|nr:hypothetical protein [Lacrimispora sp.]
MNLNEFKKEADIEEQEKLLVEKMKEDAISEFKSFLSISHKSGDAWKKKEILYVNQFISDYVKYMKNNGFTVDHDTVEISEENYPSIVSDYKGKQIILSSLNYDGEKIYLNSKEKCVAEFWVDLPTDAPRYRYWKDLLVVNGKSYVDFMNNANEPYIQFINSFNTENEMKELRDKIKVNVEHSSNSLCDIESIKLCIHKFGTNDTYKDFSDFIENVAL